MIKKGKHETNYQRHALGLGKNMHKNYINVGALSNRENVTYK